MIFIENQFLITFLSNEDALTFSGLQLSDTYLLTFYRTQCFNFNSIHPPIPLIHDNITCNKKIFQSRNLILNKSSYTNEI